MTSTTPTTTEPAPTPEPVEPTAPTEEPGEPSASREAAGYRRRLRDTEAERDTLRERVEGYERREVEAIARDLGAAVPSDLWNLMQLDELRVDGTLDVGTVRDRVSALLRERPTCVCIARTAR